MKHRVHSSPIRFELKAKGEYVILPLKCATKKLIASVRRYKYYITHSIELVISVLRIKMNERKSNLTYYRKIISNLKVKL